MKRTKISILLFVVLVTIINSCTVQSLFPLYTEKDLIYDENVLGTWDFGKDDSWDFKRKYTEQDSLKGLSPYYELTVIEEGEKAVFDAHLLRLGKYYYFNFYLTELEDNTINWIGACNMLTVNTFARTEIYADSLKIEYFNPDFLSNLIKKKKVRIKHVITGEDDHILITAPTEDIQKYVIKYEDEDELILEEYMAWTLERL